MAISGLSKRDVEHLKSYSAFLSNKKQECNIIVFEKDIDENVLYGVAKSPMNSSYGQNPAHHIQLFEFSDIEDYLYMCKKVKGFGILGVYISDNRAAKWIAQKLGWDPSKPHLMMSSMDDELDCNEDFQEVDIKKIAENYDLSFLRD